MPDHQPAPGEPEEREHPAIFIDGFGAVLVNGRPVGELNGNLLELNLGWCRMAGLSLKVHDDPQIDRHRGGVALERTVPPRG